MSPVNVLDAWLKLQSQLGLVTQACNPSTKTETKGLPIQSQFGLYNRELLPQDPSLSFSPSSSPPFSPHFSLFPVCGGWGEPLTPEGLFVTRWFCFSSLTCFHSLLRQCLSGLRTLPCLAWSLGVSFAGLWCSDIYVKAGLMSLVKD